MVEPGLGILLAATTLLGALAKSWWDARIGTRDASTRERAQDLLELQEENATEKSNRAYIRDLQAQVDAERLARRTAEEEFRMELAQCRKDHREVTEKLDRVCDELAAERKVSREWRDRLVRTEAGHLKGISQSVAELLEQELGTARPGEPEA